MFTPILLGGIIAAIFVLLITVLCVGKASAAYETITTTTQWTGPIKYLEGNLTVTSNGHLTIQDTTVYVNNVVDGFVWWPA